MGFDWSVDNSNTWSMGDFGDFGYCVEMYYRGVEIWNCVFVNGTRLADGSVKELSKPYLDSGMGLFRLQAILNEKSDIWEAWDERDIMIDMGKSIGIKDGPILRLIYDHLRTSCFIINAGIGFGSQKREYVLRKLFRRSFWHAFRPDLRINRIFQEAIVKIVKLHDLEGERISKEISNECENCMKLWPMIQKSLQSNKIWNAESVAKLIGEKGVPENIIRDFLLDNNIDIEWEKCLLYLKA
jgi:alanyl-tRNA synthetase